MGICPLYWGRSKSGAMWLASEMKAIQHQCDDWLTFFPPVGAWAVRQGPLRSCRMGPLAVVGASFSTNAMSG